SFLLPNKGSFALPQYLVRDTRQRGIHVVKRFPKSYGMEVRVYSNDHKPPHFHILDTHGKLLGRYTWPDLKPMSGDAKLSRRHMKGLMEYLRDWGPDIKERLEKNLKERLPGL